MFRCARCSGAGRPAAVNAPAVTRAGSRRPGACQGTNVAPRSTAGTTCSLSRASGAGEPGLFVIAFTYVPGRRPDAAHAGLRTSAPGSPRPHHEPSASPLSHAGRRPATPADGRTSSGHGTFPDVIVHYTKSCSIFQQIRRRPAPMGAIPAAAAS